MVKRDSGFFNNNYSFNRSSPSNHPVSLSKISTTPLVGVMLAIPFSVSDLNETNHPTLILKLTMALEADNIEKKKKTAMEALLTLLKHNGATYIKFNQTKTQEYNQLTSVIYPHGENVSSTPSPCSFFNGEPYNNSFKNPRTTIKNERDKDSKAAEQRPDSPMFHVE